MCFYTPSSSFIIFFFFQAEDGIRDLTVTGVQTCALPISCRDSAWHQRRLERTLQPSHTLVGEPGFDEREIGRRRHLDQPMVARNDSDAAAARLDQRGAVAGAGDVSLE